MILPFPEQQRYAVLNDLATRSAGGERYIDAYAAVFNRDQEIRDREGHYYERIASTAFDQSIIDAAGTKFKVLFNHGRTIHGESSEKYSMPYGAAAEVRADRVGLWTSTMVSNTALGDEIYTLARDGALEGMSFSGQFRKTATPIPGPNGLKIKERTVIAMSEFGVTPFPAYVDAQIQAVRADFASFNDDEITSVLAADPELCARLESALIALQSPATGHRSETSNSPATGHVALTPEQANRLIKYLTKGPRI